jgi:hypothetical protein
VVTGAGGEAFCAGGDLKEMANTEMKVPPPDYLPYLGRTFTLDKPARRFCPDGDEIRWRDGQAGASHFLEIRPGREGAVSCTGDDQDGSVPVMPEALEAAPEPVPHGLVQCVAGSRPVDR